MSDYKIEIINGKQYCSGTVDIGKNRTLYINTKTGQGIGALCHELKKFVYFQTAKTSFPSHTADDVAQEIYLLALEAIPKYNPGKNANIITFLHNHVKNRLINLCKFHSEKRRICQYVDTKAIKLRCNACRNFFHSSTDAGNVVCNHCRQQGDIDSDKWKHYNIAIVPLSYNTSFTTPDDQSEELDGESTSMFDRDGDAAGFIVAGYIMNPASLNSLIDVERATSDLDITNKQIFKLIYQGLSVKEISEEVSLTPKALRKRITKILSHIQDFLGDKSGKKEPSSLQKNVSGNR